MPEMTRDLIRSMLQVLVVGALFAGCLWILQPFLLSVIWAGTIVVATWPMLLWAEARLGGRRGFAVAAMTLALLLMLLVPLTLAVLAILQNADRLIGLAKSLATVRLPPPPEWLERLPLAGGWLAAQWQQIAAAGPEGLPARLAPYARAIVAWFVAQAGGVGKLAIQLFLTVIIAAILYAGGERAAWVVRRFARRLAGPSGESVVVLAVQAIRAIALGVVVTALIQSGAGGIGLLLTGVPFPIVLTAVMFILGVAQVGVGPVLIPVVVWMYWTAGAVWGTILLAWAVPVFFIDNILRPILIKRSADLPLLLIFAGVLGGLIAFGVIGLFVGPVLLAVGYTLLMAWIAETDSDLAPPPTDQA